MKLFCLLFLVFLATAAAAPIDNAPSGASFPTTLTLDRVRYLDCPPGAQNVSLCSTTLTRPQYAVFGDAGMPEVDQVSLFLSEVSRPARNATRNIAFFISGQQPREPGFGDRLGLTGQSDGFIPVETVASTDVKIPVGTLARKLFAASGLALDRTFVTVVFSPVFDFLLPVEELDRRENAYMEYLTNALPAGVAPGTVVLGGHSRGGCLAMRLARRLSMRYPSTSVAVTAMDPVCVPPFIGVSEAGEFGTQLETRQNPLQKGLFAYTLDVKRLFARRYCVFINSYVTGRSVIFPFVRGVSYSGFSNSTRRRNYLKRWRGCSSRVFYREMWTTESHDGVTYENHGDAVAWLRRGLRDNRRFGCSS